ncbi:unnamed protein product, partial [Staurois parvus]
SPYERRNCGYPGISSSDCAKRGCCFNTSVRGVNWCYYTNSDNEAQCAVSPAKRTDCGYPGINASECHSRGCCFNSTIRRVKWCFFPKQLGKLLHHIANKIL